MQAAKPGAMMRRTTPARAGLAVLLPDLPRGVFLAAALPPGSPSCVTSTDICNLQPSCEGPDSTQRTEHTRA